MVPSIVPPLISIVVTEPKSVHTPVNDPPPVVDNAFAPKSICPDAAEKIKSPVVDAIC